MTIVSDGAGHVITLAQSGGGVVTSLGGSAFTAATGEVGSATGAIGYVFAQSVHFSCHILISLFPA